MDKLKNKMAREAADEEDSSADERLISEWSDSTCSGVDGCAYVLIVVDERENERSRGQLVKQVNIQF